VTYVLLSAREVNGSGLDRITSRAHCVREMRATAKVFKNGNSWAVQLPAALKPSSRELFIETRRNGDIILYDDRLREEAHGRRMKALEEIMANPVLEKDEPL